MNKKRITLIGTGEMGHNLVQTLSKMESSVEKYGIMGRNQEKTTKFKEKFGFTKVFTSVEEIVEDNQTDLVYIATPHTLHLEQTKYFLQNNVSVICEKPITVNAKQFLELMSVSKQYQTTLVDASWIRYLPFINQVKALAEKHQLGKLKQINASIGIQKQDEDRMINPQLAGGALLDVGLYPVTYVCAFNQSEVKEIKALSTFTETGVDQSSVVLMKFEDEMLATIQCSIGAILSDTQTFGYEQGKIEVFGMPAMSLIKVYEGNEEVLEVDIELDKDGYQYQIEEAFEAIENNQIEPKSLSHRQSLKVMRILDEIRREIGLVYPFEK